MMMMMMVVKFMWEIEKENHDRKHSTAQKINHTQKNHALEPTKTATTITRKDHPPTHKKKFFSRRLITAPQHVLFLYITVVPFFFIVVSLFQLNKQKFISAVYNSVNYLFSSVFLSSHSFSSSAQRFIGSKESHRTWHGKIWYCRCRRSHFKITQSAINR